MRVQSLLLGAVSVGSLAMAGCSLSSTSTAPLSRGTALHGSVHGGQQPVVGAHVYVFAAATTGYGQPSVSLLQAAATGFSDSTGAYVPTDANGNWVITNDYSCTPNTQVYLYAQGGNAGSGNNSAAGFLAVLGNCPAAGTFAPTIPYVVIDEVSTVAAAYAFAGFATDALHVSSSATSLAQTGIANAFANAANLASISTGSALATTPAGNGTVPQRTINTIANILSQCVNSTGPTSTACTVVLGNPLSNGNTPLETASAAIGIAQNPTASVAAFFALSTASPPFSPALTAQPNDFSIGLNFAGGGLNNPFGIAIDSSGNAWVTSNTNNAVVKLSSTGAFLSGASGFTGGGLALPAGVAIDTSGNVWVANESIAAPSVTKLSATGSLLSGAAGYTGGGLNDPSAIAIDPAGNVWVTNSLGVSVTKFSSSGSVLSGVNGYTGGGIDNPNGIAIDSSGNAWITNENFSTPSVTKLSSSGGLLSGSTGYTGGGINNPQGVALDSSGNAWVVDLLGNAVTKISSSGSILSGTSGYTGGGLNGAAEIAIDGSGNAFVTSGNNATVAEFRTSGSFAGSGYTGGSMNFPFGIAIDGSGNAWVTNLNSNSVTELIGIASPVVTPLSYANANSLLGTRP